MRPVSKADLKENAERYKGCTFLEPREWFDHAILGKCIRTGGIIYDYDDLVEVYMEKDGIDYHQACMAVDFNTIRSLSYMPDPKPIVDKSEIATEQEEDEDEDE